MQWLLAVLVEVTWGFIIFDTDGIGARLYPFVWRPHHIIDVYQYAVIQALQVGAGILLGVYLMSWVADRYGRRPAILLATLLGGFCIWPFAYVTDFWGMVVLSVLSTLGVGGIVATHSVYLSEMTSPLVRNKVLLASQGVTALVAVGVNMLAFWLIPGQWQGFLWVSAAVEIIILLPLLYLMLPESPRWLEAHGRHEEAERAMAEYEATLPALHHRTAGRAGRRRQPGRHGQSRRLEGTVHQPAIPQPHLGADHLLAGRLRRPDLRRRRVLRRLHGGPWRLGARGVRHRRRRLRWRCSSASRSTPGSAKSVERRDVIALMATLFAACWIVAWVVPSLSVIALCYIVSRIGTGLFLFNLYNYTAVAYPTRIRSVAFAWTDGLGHLGAWGGVTLLGPLYQLGPNHLGWILWIVVPGALLPALLIRGLGIKQARAVLEQVSR